MINEVNLVPPVKVNIVLSFISLKCFWLLDHFCSVRLQGAGTFQKEKEDEGGVRGGVCSSQKNQHAASASMWGRGKQYLTVCPSYGLGAACVCVDERDVKSFIYLIMSRDGKSTLIPSSSRSKICKKKKITWLKLLIPVSTQVKVNAKINEMYSKYIILHNSLTAKLLNRVMYMYEYLL